MLLACENKAVNNTEEQKLPGWKGNKQLKKRWTGATFLKKIYCRGLAKIFNELV